MIAVANIVPVGVTQQVRHHPMPPPVGNEQNKRGEQQRAQTPKQPHQENESPHRFGGKAHWSFHQPYRPSPSCS